MNTQGICPDCGRTVDIRDGQRVQHDRPDTGEPCHYPPAVKYGDVPDPFQVIGATLAPIRVDLHVHVTGDGIEAVNEFLTGVERWVSDNPGKLTRVRVPPSPARIEAEARTLYEAYRAKKPMAVDGIAIPSWEENTKEDVKDAWRATAQDSLERNG